MAIVIFQHHEAGRPGRLGVTLRDHAFRLDIRRLDKGDPIPGDYDDVEAVVSLGGPQNVGGREHWLVKEMDYLRGAHERGLPVVGICLGHQLLAAALGAEVGPMDRPECGMLPVDILPAAQTDTILAGIAWRSWQFHSHGYEAKAAPPGATVLASSAACRVQAFRAGLRTYGFQYHFETDRDIASKIIADERDVLHRAGLTTDEVLRQYDKHYEMYARLGDRLSLNIASYLIPRMAAALA